VIAYSKAIELGRVQSDAYSGLAKALIKTRRYAEAEEAASKAIELGGANHADRGQARTERGKLEEGLSDYLVALKSAPDDGGILRDLGLIHLRRGRPADALPYLRKARDVGRKDACPLLGDCLLRLGRLAESDAAFTEAVDALPKDHLARFGRARTRQALGRRAEAIADLDAALALAPSFAPGYALRGTLKLEEERHDEAAADLTKAVDLEPALAEPLKDALKDARREP
jgi:tetratricopeptide (TPR) repeat protein